MNKIGTLDNKDRSFSLEIGFNNIGFWRRLVNVKFRFSKHYKLLHLNILWLTFRIQSPSDYHMTAIYAIVNEKIKESLLKAQEEK